MVYKTKSDEDWILPEIKDSHGNTMHIPLQILQNPPSMTDFFRNLQQLVPNAIDEDMLKGIPKLYCFMGGDDTLWWRNFLQNPLSFFRESFVPNLNRYKLPDLVHPVSASAVTATSQRRIVGTTYEQISVWNRENVHLNAMAAVKNAIDETLPVIVVEIEKKGDKYAQGVMFKHITTADTFSRTRDRIWFDYSLIVTSNFYLTKENSLPDRVKQHLRRALQPNAVI